MFVVALGALDLGFQLVGPFSDEDEAQAWVDRYIAQKTPFWDILPVKDAAETGKITDTVKRKGE